MIICVCKSVSDRAIRQTYQEGYQTYDELQFELGFGTCCGKCTEHAQHVIAECHHYASGECPKNRCSFSK